MLEHGLLIAAKSLDDLRIVTEKKAGKLEEDDDEPTETFEDYQLRVNAFVAMHLASASSSKRDNYKDGQVYQERKAVIHEFLKATITKKCQNPGCGAYVILTLSIMRLSKPLYYYSDTRTHSARRATQNSSSTTCP